MYIRYYRQIKGMTAKQLAEEIGASESSVSLYERDSREPSTDRLIKMAKALDVSVDELLRGPQVAREKYGKEAPAVRHPETVLKSPSLAFYGPAEEQPTDAADEKLLDAVRAAMKVIDAQKPTVSQEEHKLIEQLRTLDDADKQMIINLVERMAKK